MQQISAAVVKQVSWAAHLCVSGLVDGYFMEPMRKRDQKAFLFPVSVCRRRHDELPDRFSSALEKSLETLTGNYRKQKFCLTSAQRFHDILLTGLMRSFYHLDWFISVWENQDRSDQHADTESQNAEEDWMVWWESCDVTPLNIW